MARIITRFIVKNKLIMQQIFNILQINENNCLIIVKICLFLKIRNSKFLLRQFFSIRLFPAEKREP